MGMYLSQRKYVLEMLNSRPVDTPMDYHVKLDANMGRYLRMLDSIDSWLGSLFTLLLPDQTSLMQLESLVSLRRPLGSHIRRLSLSFAVLKGCT